jgi:hypothetical protein
MAKPGLGKGLGDLMNGDQVAGKSRVIKASAAPEIPEPHLGRGLTTLVGGRPQNGEAELPDAKSRRLPRWFYFAADILLLAFVVGITFDANRPYDLGTIAFCAVSVGLGCLLAVIGVIRD